MQIALFLTGMFAALELTLGHFDASGALGGFSAPKQALRRDSEQAPRQVTIIENGLNYSVPLSGNATVGEILARHGIHTKSGDFVSPAPETKVEAGETIITYQATPLKLIEGGVKSESFTLAHTVGGFFVEKGIVLNPLDVVMPDISTPITLNLKVKIKRRVVENSAEILEIPFPHITHENPSASYGKITVTKTGVAGKKNSVFEILKEDGTIIRKKIIQETILQKPKAQEETRGTRIVIGRIDEAQGSWYKAFTGMYAASTTYPRGTFVRVTNLQNNKSVIVKINDYGPTISGRIIDLEVTAFKKLAPKITGVIPVRVEQIL